tara:strand:- start:6395 stop:7027 length:633 start_codon:yes stop_codon:yes gene_type:complete
MTIPISLLKDAALKAGLEKLLDQANIAEQDLKKFMPMLETQDSSPMDLVDAAAYANAAPPAQPMPNQMQRSMNVRPADPQRMANMENIKQALDSDSALDNLAMMRMQKAAGGGQALESFSGQVPGEGHGMEDNVYMPIVDKGDQVATLAVSPDEYVVDAHTMSALGNGSADEGADVMDQIVKEVRQEAFGTTQQPNQINGLQSLRNKMIG